MGRNVLALVAAIVFGSLVVWLVEKLGHTLYPYPEGMDPTDYEAIKEYIKTAPTGAMLMVILAHFLGALASGIVVTKIAKSSHFVFAIISGAIFMVFGIMNIMMIPGPTWFAIADLATYIPGALIGYLLVKPKA
ncbi:MAG: hypothetical protein JXQ87_00065 [Bacteroidia bacterium]